jgi:cytochrome c peroxidase
VSCHNLTNAPQQKWISRTFVKAYGHNGYFKSLKAIVHFYNTRDVLTRCQPNDPGEGTTCWPAPEEESALVSFMQTLTDGFMQRDQR